MTQATAVISNHHSWLNDADCAARIDAENRAPRGRAIVAGRHCQRAGVAKDAGLTDNPLALTEPAVQADACYIEFCGANFMAEAVDVLSGIDRLDLPHPAWCLGKLVNGNVLNAIRVPGRDKPPARWALQRMLALS